MNCYSFYEKYQKNDNEWWKLSEGEMQNLHDDAMGEIFGWEKTTNEQNARAEAAEAERDAATQEVERLRGELVIIRKHLRRLDREIGAALGEVGL